MDSSPINTDLQLSSFHLQDPSPLQADQRRQLERELFGEDAVVSPPETTPAKQGSLLEEDLHLSDDSDESVSLSDMEDDTPLTTEVTAMDPLNPAGESIQDTILHVLSDLTIIQYMSQKQAKLVDIHQELNTFHSKLQGLIRPL